jgi:hypothetical protein
MNAVIVLTASMLAFFVFFVAYCRSLVATSAGAVVSKETQAVIGISSDPSARDFDRVVRVLQLSERGLPARHASLRTVQVYHALLSLLQSAVAFLSSPLASRIDEERAACAKFVALLLQPRIALVIHSANK